MLYIVHALLASAFAAASFGGLSCKNIFSSGEPAVEISAPAAKRSLVWQQVRQLEPQWDVPLEQAPQMLLQLRALELQAQNKDFVVDTELAERLQAVFGKKYDLPTKIPKHLRIFFANALRSFSSRILWEWKAREIARLTGVNYSGDLLNVAQKLMDSFLSDGPWPFERASVEQLQAYFENRPWEKFPWGDVMFVVEQYLMSGESFYKFHGWYESRPDLPTVSFADRERILLALARRSAPVNCCKSPYACMNCPNNLMWLRTKDASKDALE